MANLARLCQVIPKTSRLVASALPSHHWLHVDYEGLQSSQVWSFQAALPCSNQSLLVVRRWKVCANVVSN